MSRYVINILAIRYLNEIADYFAENSLEANHVAQQTEGKPDAGFGRICRRWPLPLNYKIQPFTGDVRSGRVNLIRPVFGLLKIGMGIPQITGCTCRKLGGSSGIATYWEHIAELNRFLQSIF